VILSLVKYPVPKESNQLVHAEQSVSRVPKIREFLVDNFSQTVKMSLYMALLLYFFN